MQDLQRSYPKLVTSKQCENTTHSHKSIQYQHNIIEEPESNTKNLIDMVFHKSII